MVDLGGFLLSPFGLTAITGIAIVVIVMTLFRGGLSSGKKEVVIIAERVKVDKWIYDFKAIMFRAKNPGEIMVKLSDGRKYVIPEEKKGDYQEMYWRQKKRTFKIWPIEKGQIVKWSDNLTEQSNPMMDQSAVTSVVNRTSLARLAALKNLSGDKWLMIIMGVVVGVSIGYIMYPQVNHPAPIYEFCTRLANGTMLPRGCPG